MRRYVFFYYHNSDTLEAGTILIFPYCVLTEAHIFCFDSFFNMKCQYATDKGKCQTCNSYCYVKNNIPDICVAIFIKDLQSSTKLVNIIK